MDTAWAFACYYAIPHNYLNLFEYIPWDEDTINQTLIGEYNWETATDTKSTWRIGDGTAAFSIFSPLVISCPLVSVCRVSVSGPLRRHGDPSGENTWNRYPSEICIEEDRRLYRELGCRTRGLAHLLDEVGRRLSTTPRRPAGRRGCSRRRRRTPPGRVPVLRFLARDRA